MDDDGPAPGQGRATLLYPVVDDEVLLIRKRRGLGAGNLVGAGGGVEAGETPREAAVREVREEVRATPTGVEAVGVVDFHLGGDPAQYIHVYRGDGLAGTPEPTPEARPAWYPLDDVPYGEMWESDRHWLPHVLSGTPFRATVRYDDAERLLDHEVEAGVEP